MSTVPGPDAERDLYIASYAPNEAYRYIASAELQLPTQTWQSVVLSAPTNFALSGQDMNYAIFGSLGRRHLSMIEMPIAGAHLSFPVLS